MALEVQKNTIKNDFIIKMFDPCLNLIHKICLNFSPKFIDLYASIYSSKVFLLAKNWQQLVEFVIAVIVVTNFVCNILFCVLL